MIRRPPRSTRTDTLFPDTTLFRSICLVGKTHDYHAEVALGVSLDENVGMIADSIAEVVRRGREAIFDCEHFFDGRSEEHTSELQSLMRISYAVFCLKKTTRERLRRAA